MYLRQFFKGLSHPVTWLRRTVFGIKSEDIGEGASDAHKPESPARLTVRRFFRKRSSLVALTILILLLTASFVLPLFLPLDVNYTNPMMANLSPTFDLRRLPRGFKKEVASITAFSKATVGVSRSGRLFLWGATYDALTDIDLAELPEALLGESVFIASIGQDHAYAITESGKLIGWGNDSRGQLGGGGAGLLAMPRELPERLDPALVTSLVCGYQATALVYDGKLYLWGNPKALGNMEEAVMANYDNVASVAMTRSSLMILLKDGRVIYPDEGLAREPAVSSRVGEVEDLEAYLTARRVVKLVGSAKCFGFLTEDGELLVQGAAAYGEKEAPLTDIVFRDLSAGERHFAACDEKGNVYSWGDNASGQCELNGRSGGTAFAAGEQTYLVSASGELLSAVGRASYPFGTDAHGRCVFTRLIHGGKMTMTVGLVAVLISSVIAILVGLTSGYFGGWVDLLLMRLTEIFSAIPFLPFAMLLSYVLRSFPIGESTRIFLIMVILGLLSWTGLARVIRGQVLAEREKEFVMAAGSMGVTRRTILFRHILPNVLSVMLVSVTLSFAGCLLTESSLSYLGFGVQQPNPTWGNMLNGANSSLGIGKYWWQWLFPALFLSAATVAINLIGDNLRDAFDPRSDS